MLLVGWFGFGWVGCLLYFDRLDYYLLLWIWFNWFGAVVCRFWCLGCCGCLVGFCLVGVFDLLLLGWVFVAGGWCWGLGWVWCAFFGGR